MGDDILNVYSGIGYDDKITSVQHHIYSPYTHSFNNDDEIRIVIQHQDLYVLPHESYIYIEGRNRITVGDDAEAAARIAPNYANNAAGFLFDEIRYEINNFPIDICKNVGITSTIKGYLSFQEKDMNHMQIAGWNTASDKQAREGYINFCIPLKSILGFAEDYRHLMINAKHELVLVRSRFDVNCYTGANNIARITIDKIQWRIPHISVSDAEKLKLMQIVNKKQPIHMYFRSWELYEYPTLPTTNSHIWSVKASAQLNTPRYIIIAFQTNRNLRIAADKSRFDHCGLTELKVYLNSECYPYENLNVNFTNDKYAVLYDMYARFQQTYYHDRPSFCSSALLTYEEYKTQAPIFVVDCSRQNESLKKSIVDIRIEFQTQENIEANTAAYCMIIHDNLITYNPYSNIVNRLM